MPRLTPQDYLVQRRLLIIEEWYEHDALAFGDIPTSGQRDLHDFYAPTAPMSDADALKHRAAMTKAFPSLPHKAGRALQALKLGQELYAQRVAAAQVAQRDGKRTVKKGGVRIAAVVRPHPDVRHLAKALIGMSRYDTDGSILKVMLEQQKRR